VAVELLLADDHLPAGLGEGDRLEDLDRDVVVAGGGVEGVGHRAEELVLGGGGVLGVAAVLGAAGEVDPRVGAGVVAALIGALTGGDEGEGGGEEGIEEAGEIEARREPEYYVEVARARALLAELMAPASPAANT